MRSLLLIIVLAGAQSSAPVVSGRVVSTSDGSTIAQATVTITPADGRQGAALVLTTNETGRFVANGLRAGRYRVLAQHEAYMRGAESSTATDIDSTTQNVVLRLTPTGVIAGRILDEDNEPLARAYVRAAQGDVVREAQTNDLGEYRIYGLPPGRYVVSATLYLAPRLEKDRYIVPTPPSPFSRGEGQGMMGLERMVAAGDYLHPMAIRGESHQRTFYPGTPDAAAAALVDVGAGAVVAGIELRTLPAARP